MAENIKELEVEEGKQYSKEKLPMDMNSNREVLSYKDVVMEVQGKSLRGVFRDLVLLNENNIICIY